MPCFEIVVHDPAESYDEDVPPSLLPLREWQQKNAAGRAPFSLHPYQGAGFSLGEEKWVQSGWSALDTLGSGCRAAALRLSGGGIALLRTDTGNPGAYVVFSADDPVRVALVVRNLPEDRPFPYWPNSFYDDDETVVQRFLLDAAARAETWFAPTGNRALDRAEGRHLRLPRAALIADLLAEAERIERVVSRS